MNRLTKRKEHIAPLKEWAIKMSSSQLPQFEINLLAKDLNPLTTMGHLCPSISVAFFQSLIKIHDWVSNKIKINTKIFSNAHFFVFVFCFFKYIAFFMTSHFPQLCRLFYIFLSDT